ncbi:MAG: anaerobic ribonucleoside-triphosphate reductase activating protein [Erysipelotrichaceae bacterium]|nr:anaerobic ribonucleoside-triphosphate reductase activating protein [Erysipelotrichaceae bacterium]
MNYAEIKWYDIANGPGVRVSLFVSGCRRHCKNCFNSAAWDFHYGKPFDDSVQQQILDHLANDYIQGITLLGGEPFEAENQRELLPFLKKIKQQFPDKTIWAFSGNVWEEITSGNAHCEVTEELLSYLDVLVDGPFVQELYDISLRFRGSSNQRILDVQKSLQASCPVEWVDAPIYASHKL